MRLYGNIFFNVIIWNMAFSLYSVPLVVGINNKSDIGYRVVYHIDASSCTFQGKNVEIPVQYHFKREFLLPHKPDVPSLILRPAFYIDPQTQKKIIFLNQYNVIDQEALKDAFLLWKKGKGKSYRSIKTPQKWMKKWIGGDISVYGGSEFAGYLRDQVRINIDNKRAVYKSMLSYSKGVFGKLQLEIIIAQDRNRPINVTMKVLHGSGGICAETLDDHGTLVGKVEHIS